MSRKPKYKYSSEVESELEGFKIFLVNKNLEENTVRQHRNYAGIYLQWISSENLEIKQVRYKDIIAFIQYMQSENHKVRFINRVVLAVRHFYYYLEVPKNPAAGIFIRGTISTVPVDLVPYPEIINLYDLYQALDNRTKRNKVMLGFMIYQAVTTRELHYLEPHHIKLNESKIYIPATNRSLARVLAIHVRQLLDLQEYLNTVRQDLQEEVKYYKSYKFPKQIDWQAVKEQLFFSQRGDSNIKTSLYHMFKNIKKLNPKITSARIIRQSVIAEWTKTNGIRQVQYMSGYRCVGSVERYRDYHLEELTEALQECHPLK